MVDGRLHCNDGDDDDDNDDDDDDDDDGDDDNVDDDDDDDNGLNELLSDEKMLTHLKVYFCNLVNEILPSKTCNVLTLNSFLFSINILCLKIILLVTLTELPQEDKIH